MRARGVLVVGDGPAGCAAAIAAVRAGCAVTMVGSGRARPVPECASSAALGLLDWLAPELVTQPQIWLDAPTQAGRAVDRGQLDNSLRAAAVRAGVDYRQMAAAGLRPAMVSGRVVGMTGGGLDVGDRWVIDASGVNGWLRRHLGLEEIIDSRPWWLQRGFGTQAAEQGEPPFNIAPHGWLWQRATAGGCIWTALSSMRGGAVNWPSGMRPTGRIWLEKRHWRHLRCAAGAGYFVCGDAAGYLDPATGDGLRFALESGARAGGLAAATLRWPERASVAEALYADWVLQTYRAGRAALVDIYGRAGLQVR